jgi:hypothetical protein
MRYSDAYLAALNSFTAAQPGDMASAAGGSYSKQDRLVEFLYLGHTCRVSHPQGEIAVSGWPKLSPEEEIIILQYLAGATGVPPRGQWLSFLQLTGGPHHFAPFQKEAISPLARHFGNDPEKFREAARSLGGSPVALGQAGMIIYAFPRLPLGFVLWAADEEFPASANILFDASAEMHLATASLYMLGIAVTQRLMCYPAHPPADWYQAVL